MSWFGRPAHAPPYPGAAPQPVVSAAGLVLKLCDDVVGHLQGQPGLVVRRVRDELAEPQLRVAVVGRVSAGKSTLVNAMLGRPVAPTDAGECTRSVVCYRYGREARTTVHLRAGAPVDLPDGVPAELPAPPEAVAYLEVRLPADPLRRVTVIDSPGISSAGSDVSVQTHELVSGRLGAAPTADAIAFVLTQNVREDEQRLLQEIDRSTLLVPSSVHTVGVLTKADLLAGGGPDAWEAAGTLAKAIAEDHRGRFAAVVPVLGLLAEAGHCRLLTADDAQVLATVAAEWDAADREIAFLAPEMFTAQESGVPAGQRAALVTKVGLGGVRALVAAVDRGTTGADQLNALCRRLSGYDELRAVLIAHFQERADALKACRALAALDRIVHGALGRQVPPPLRAWMQDRLEAVRLDPRTHRIRELEALHRVLAGEVALPEVLEYDLVGLVQDAGWTPGALGVAEWQRFEAAAPSAAQRAVARVVIRSHALAAGARTENA